MKTISQTEALDQMIIEARRKCDNDLVLLKDQLHVVYESVKPFNLIKGLIHDVTSAPEIKNNMVSNVIGLGTGLLSKKFLLGSSHNPIKSVLGNILQFAITNVVSKHANGIKAVGGMLFSRFVKNKRS